MSGERPFLIEGVVIDISPSHEVAYAKVVNGNVYHLFQSTSGLNFNRLEKGQKVLLEVTTKLTQVLSARIIE